jgi:hypothetical protein
MNDTISQMNELQSQVDFGKKYVRELDHMLRTNKGQGNIGLLEAKENDEILRLQQLESNLGAIAEKKNLFNTENIKEQQELVNKDTDTTQATEVIEPIPVLGTTNKLKMKEITSKQQVSGTYLTDEDIIYLKKKI